MAQAAARKKAAASPAAGRGRGENLLPPLRVRYYKRMHRQRVYDVTVGWQKSTIRPPAGSEPVRLRLIMAGAQVVPSEQPLDPNHPDDSATFYVTPLAAGSLRAERIEVLIQGRKVQELPLPARVVSQRSTLVLLLLAFLIPWLLFTFIRPKESRQVEPLDARDFQVPAYITQYVPTLPSLFSEVSLYVAATWRALHLNMLEHPLEVYWCLGLLFLALLSWVSHSSRRKRRVGKPIPLPRAAAEY